MSLVRGVQMALKAVALSVKPGGSVGSAGRCAPPVRTSSRSRWTGRSTTSMSPVGSPLPGRGSDAVHLGAAEVRGLDRLEISAAAGERIVRTG